MGTSAGENNTTGGFNIMVGRWAGRNNTTASNQILIGGMAGSSLVNGAENVMIGHTAGTSNVEGQRNVFIGTAAGWSNTGSYNVIIGGYRVGYGTFQNVSNRLIIEGNGSVNAVPLVYGEFDNRRFAINTTSPTRTLDVDGDVRFRGVTSGSGTNVVMSAAGTLFTSSSDRRLKANFAPYNNVLGKLLKVKTYSFDWMDPEHGSRDIGFIAQEIMEIFPEVVFQNQTDKYYGINYSQFTPILVEAVKEQQQQIDDLKRENEALREQINLIIQAIGISEK